MEGRFRQRLQRRRLRFECSMLQTAVEGSDGQISWRDVTCEDADDFEALWALQWIMADHVETMWSYGCHLRGLWNGNAQEIC